MKDEKQLKKETDPVINGLAGALGAAILIIMFLLITCEC